MKRASCSTILFFVSYASIAGAPSVNIGWSDGENKIIDESYLNVSGVVIGTTSFDEIIKMFGESEVVKQHKQHIRTLCYKSSYDDTGVVFGSGPFGGWGDSATSIWIGKVDLLDASQCAESRLMGSREMVVNGLSLDSGIADVLALLGKPLFQGSSFAVYRYATKTTFPGDDSEYDVLSGLEFKFGQRALDKRRLDWFRIYLTVSN